jgi:His-Xaa-Ser repeat protein HxsA
MKPLKLFALAALAAAGFSPSNSQAAGEERSVSKATSFTDLSKLIELMEHKQTYTLAGHSSHASHASHGSHGSHASHRSYYKPPEIDQGDDTVSLPNPSIELAVARNDRSTPATSVLPSSPAITKKLKVLKGNSPKFKDIVTQSQLALLARGHDVGAVNGELDARTRAAIFKFQSASGFAPDGKLTPQVLSALNIAAN